MMCRYYSIPPDILLPGPGANQLVLVETEGGQNVPAITFAVSQLVPA
jgi:hypothetical protein